MTNYIEYNQSYIFSSDPVVGAANISGDASEFDVILDNPIHIGNDSVNCTVEVTQANVWNTSPNISVLKDNNTIPFTDGITPGTITIPDGLYSVTDLNNTISRELATLGYADDLFSIQGDNATQKVIITFPYAGTQLDFTGASTVREILGFNARLVPLAPSTAGETDTGDNIAAFNQINSYLIHCNVLAQDGIPVNAIGSGIIADVPITVGSGSLIVYSPFNPTQTQADHLIGFPVSSFRIRLTNENNESVEVLDPYSFILVIRYYKAIKSVHRIQ